MTDRKDGLRPECLVIFGRIYNLCLWVVENGNNPRAFKMLNSIKKMRVTYKMVYPVLDKIHKKQPLTLADCELLQKSDYSRFEIIDNKLRVFTPEEFLQLYNKKNA